MTWQAECAAAVPLGPRSSRFYPRANPQAVIDMLAALAQVLHQAGWEERGGYLLRNERGEVTGRTKWIPRAQWWAERPDKFSERHYAGIVLKHIRGGRLTKRETACLMYLIEIADNVNQNYGESK